MDTVQSLHGQHGSVEEFSAAMAPTGWEIEFRQLDRGRSRMEMDLVGTSESLLHGDLGLSD
jgi:hypothetical protein